MYIIFYNSRYTVRVRTYAAVRVAYIMIILRAYIVICIIVVARMVIGSRPVAPDSPRNCFVV